MTTGRGYDGPRVNVRLSADERATCERAAKRAGQTLAAWVRDAALRAAAG